MRPELSSREFYNLEEQRYRRCVGLIKQPVAQAVIKLGSLPARRLAIKTLAPYPLDPEKREGLLMKAAIKFQFITLSLYFTLMSGCGSHIKVKCPPDGRTVLVLKDLSKVYPVYAKEYDIAAKKIQKAIGDTLKSNTISAGYSDKVIKFREDLKQEAINLENQLKAALLNRQTDPCDKDAGKRFDELLKVISSKNAKLEGMSLKLLSIHVSGDLNIQLDRTKYRPLLPNGSKQSRRRSSDGAQEIRRQLSDRQHLS